MTVSSPDASKEIEISADIAHATPSLAISHQPSQPPSKHPDQSEQFILPSRRKINLTSEVMSTRQKKRAEEQGAVFALDI
jgi:hypothetical protein